MRMKNLAGEHNGPAGAFSRVLLVEIDSAGGLIVRTADGRQFVCDWLDDGGVTDLKCGDELLALEPASLARGVALGRIGRYMPPQPASDLSIQAANSLTLQCGESSLTLRADGKVLLKGDDVVIRAKGTQRIRAGTVAIN